MTKHLRLIMLSLLAMICMGGYSQSETVFKTLSFPDANQQTNKVQNYSTSWTAKIGDDTWSIDNCNNNNWSNDWKHIAMGSKSGATVASIATDKPLTAAITKVVVNYGTVVNLPKNLNSLKLIVASDNGFNNDVETIDGDKSFSTDGQSTFTITTPAEGRYFKLEYDLNKTVDGKNNAKNGVIQIKTVEYYTKPASSKTPTTTTFGTNYDGKTFNFVNGVLEGWKAPTATQTLAGVDGKISYESDKPDVATVDANGQLTFKSYGTATITATFTPKDTEKYAESTASYTVINKRTPTTITFGKEVDNNTFKVKDGETFEGRVAYCTTEGATGKIVYKSSDEDIAKVDATTGAITLGAKYGTATITAQFVATGNYANSEARYSIKHLEDFVFYESFDNCDGTGGNDDTFSGSIAFNDWKAEKLDEVWTNRGKVYLGNKCIRIGKDASSVTTSSIEYTGKSILTFKAAAWSTEDTKVQLTITGGTLKYGESEPTTSVSFNPTKGEWQTFEMEVTSTGPFTLQFANETTSRRFFLDEVMIKKVNAASPKVITLDENGDNIVEEAENVNVTLKRTLYGDGGWNTLCVPFSLTEAQTKAAFGADVELRELESVAGNTLTFKTVNSVTANVPCLIKVTAAGNEYKFEGVSTTAVKNNRDYTLSLVEGNILFLGIYSAMDVVEADLAESSTNGYYAFLGAKNTFFKAKAGSTMKAFRAFFSVPNDVNTKQLKAVIDGTTTGIEDLVIDGVKANGRVYNLNGQYVGNSLNGLQPGLYIQNGKKIVVK